MASLFSRCVPNFCFLSGFLRDYSPRKKKIVPSDRAPLEFDEHLRRCLLPTSVLLFFSLYFLCRVVSASHPVPHDLTLSLRMLFIFPQAQ